MINGRRIRQLRELTGLSREELAEAAGISPRLLQAYENGVGYAVPPSDEVAEALAMRCGFPASFLCRDDPPDMPLGSLLFHEISAKHADDARARGERVCDECDSIMAADDECCMQCGWIPGEENLPNE